MQVKASENGMQTLAHEISLWVKPGGVINLVGDVGAGKTSFARALIRSLANAPEMEIPSPTFPLVQLYSETRIPVAHLDLYRIKQASEAEELGLFDLLASHLLIVEWPDRYPVLERLEDVLTIHISGSSSERTYSLSYSGSWTSAFRRNQEIRDFLNSTEAVPFERRFFQGDASTRRYELVTSPAGTSVLMDMPARSDRTPVMNGKSYSATVHLADDISPVLAINYQLNKMGYAVPVTHAADAAAGFALQEYLQGELHGEMMLRGDDMTEPMRSAVEVLADMAAREWPSTVSTTQGVRHSVPEFDIDALAFETSLLPSWFWPHLFNSPAPEDVAASFDSVWRSLLKALPVDRKVWVIRDYHSPNLIWMPQSDGFRRTGIIDSQDAVLGHPAYDLASLLQDARVDVDPDVQDSLFQYYVELRHKQAGFNEKNFAAAYAVLGAQRSSRLLGTFTRLSKRDGKHQYLKHRPRVARYLVRNLQHPVLAPLKDWYQTNLPQVLELAGT